MKVGLSAACGRFATVALLNQMNATSQYRATIGSAELNRLDPKAYLREVLSRIADRPVDLMAALLPWNRLVPARVESPAITA